MEERSGWNPSSYGLENHGLKNINRAYWNLSAGELYEHAIRRDEGHIAHLGPLVVNTGQHTGRSPNDKFIVREASSEKRVWWGKVNRPFEQAGFDKLREKVLAHLQEETSTYRIASPEPTPNTASRSGSSRNTPGTASSPATCSCARIGTRERPATSPNSPSSTSRRSKPTGSGRDQFAHVHPGGFRRNTDPDRRHELRGRDEEIDLHAVKLPAAAQGVLSMHCSANIGKAGDTAIFSDCRAPARPRSRPTLKES